MKIATLAVMLATTSIQAATVTFIDPEAGDYRAATIEGMVAHGKAYDVTFHYGMAYTDFPEPRPLYEHRIGNTTLRAATLALEAEQVDREMMFTEKLRLPTDFSDPEGYTAEWSADSTANPVSYPKSLFENRPFYAPGFVDTEGKGAWITLSDRTDILVGDFNGDGVLDADDINELTYQMSIGSQDPKYAISGYGFVTSSEISSWIYGSYNSYLGDANLDGEFDSSDLIEVLAANTYERDVDAVWTTGDFRGTGRFDSDDLLFALSGNGYEAGPRLEAVAVPEPAAWVLFVIGVLMIARKP